MVSYLLRLGAQLCDVENLDNAVYNARNTLRAHAQSDLARTVLKDGDGVGQCEKGRQNASYAVKARGRWIAHTMECTPAQF